MQSVTVLEMNFGDYYCREKTYFALAISSLLINVVVSKNLVY